MRLPTGVRRLLNLGVFQSRVRRDVGDELAHHFAEAMAAARRRGCSEEEALAETRARFGNEGAYRAALERIDEGRVRMRERIEWLDAGARTITVALRGIGRSPGFAFAIVSILALGIGANAVMFGVVDRLLLSPPQHVVDATQVRHLYVRRQYFNGEIGASQMITYPDFRDFESAGAFASIAAYTSSLGMTVGRGPEARRARVVTASASLFPLLGVEPALGRFFAADEDALNANPTAVLSYEYWEREHGGDPAVLGRSLDVGDGLYTIVGVAPPGFTGATLEPIDIWLPLLTVRGVQQEEQWVESRGAYWVNTVARLAAGATAEAAEAEATAAHRGGRAEMIADERYDENAEVLVAPIIAAHGPNPTGESLVARWLAGVSLIVLLIACFNVANLLLARAIRSRREVAVRLALGISRRRLTSELVTESTLLALMGSGAAVLVARFMGDAVHQALLPNVAFAGNAAGPRLLGFTLVATLFAGLLTGGLPALHTGRSELSDALRAGGRGLSGRRSRTRTALLVGQAALSVVLLVGAGLFVQSLRAARSVDLGYDPSRVVVLSLQWERTLPGEERTAIYDDVLARIRRLQGVDGAGLTYTVPFRSSLGLGQPRVPGLDSIPRHRNGGPYVNKVGSGYFEAMDLDIVQGRAFEPFDDVEEAAPAAIVSRSMADAIWPGGGALGACMIIGGDDGPCTEIVGVVENHNRQALVEDDPHFLYYVNKTHPGFRGPPQALIVATTADRATVLGLLRAEARTSSSQIRFVSAESMSDYIEPEMRSWTLGASMFTVFGMLALIVAGWGLYSVLAFDVALRKRELGIRVALGAGVRRMVKLVLRQALGLIGLGVLIGLGLAAGASRWVEPLLFRVSATDPLTFAGVALSLVMVAAVAGSLPAWRATRVDPREALQAE